MRIKSTMAIGSVVLASVLAISLYGLGQTLAAGKYEDDDRDLDHVYGKGHDNNDQRNSTKTNPLYAEECGSCHMAYPAMLLPERSWRKIMAGLENHFGETAELDDQTRVAIENYLVAESARKSYRKLFRNLGDATPMRITELPYFAHEHDEIPRRFVAGNKQVKSLSQCNACHRDAERGRFDEDDVVIPGVGRWDD